MFKFKYILLLLILMQHCEIEAMEQVATVEQVAANDKFVYIFAHGLGASNEQVEMYQGLVIPINATTAVVSGAEHYGRTVLAQSGDIANLEQEIITQCTTKTDCKIVLVGVSKGAATIINTVGKLAQDNSQFLKNIKALVLESSPADFNDVAFEAYCPYPVKWVLGRTISQFFIKIAMQKFMYPNYDPNGIQPIKSVNEQWQNVPKDLVIILVHSKQDKFVTISHSRKLYDALKKQEFVNLYYIQAEQGNHNHLLQNYTFYGSKFIQDLDPNALRKLYTIYLKHGLPLLLNDATKEDFSAKLQARIDSGIEPSCDSLQPAPNQWHEFDKNQTEESVYQKLKRVVQNMRHKFGDSKAAAWLRNKWKSITTTDRVIGDTKSSPAPINQTPTTQKIFQEFCENTADPSSQCFRFCNLKQLLEYVGINNEAQLKVNPRPTPVFNIIVSDSSDLSSEQIAANNQFVDISEIMKKPQNSGAVFQFASNDDPTLTSGGGQAAAFLAATKQAAIFRETNSTVKSLNTTGNSPADIDNILIGLHKNVSVDGCSSEQKIHLSIVAARSDPGKVEYSINCLNAAYQGTLLSAASLIHQNGAPKVFLTMMGVGIFWDANPMNIVVDAIELAVGKYVPLFGLNVTLIYWRNHYRDSKYDTNRDALIAIRNQQELRLFALAKDYNGYICTIDKNPKFEKNGEVKNLENLSESTK
ncbi:MAG: hypothetical protein US49_C0007G0019 [candidate division TM6 bacterium GW2011_GWF2_37_49]|nr:MAG: hypothetical protein US49_C0007G0019 [candidate division TM6 bacterium GW2011_GWF2_37_49]